MNTLIKNALKNEILTLLDKYPTGLTTTKLAEISLAKKRYESEFRLALAELQDGNQVELIMRKRGI